MNNYAVRGCIVEKEEGGWTNVNPFVPEEQAQFWGVYKRVADGRGGTQEIHQADFNNKEDAILFIAALQGYRETRHNDCPFCDKPWREYCDDDNYPNYCPGCGNDFTAANKSN